MVLDMRCFRSSASAGALSEWSFCCSVAVPGACMVRCKWIAKERDRVKRERGRGGGGRREREKAREREREGRRERERTREQESERERARHRESAWLGLYLLADVTSTQTTS